MLKLTRKNKDSDLVVIGNGLIDAHYRLSLIETRLIKYAAVQARENNTTLFPHLPITIRIDEFAKFFPDMDRKSAYAQVKEAINKLYNRDFSWTTLVPFEEGKGVGMTEAVHRSRWVYSTTYVDGNGMVQLCLTPAVIDQISRLETEFTSYALKQIVNLQSAYSIRIYELLAQYKGIGERYFIVSDLRNILQLGDKHARYNDLKRDLLIPAIEEINANTDLAVSFEEYKVGRSVAQIKFSIKLKITETKRRKKISRLEAERMAKIGESWPDLLARIGKEYIITDL
jgi:plasmid replication initiation protein